MKTCVGFVLAVIMMSVGLGASAATYYSDESAFLSAAGAVSLESFEGLPADNGSLIRSQIAVTDFTMTATGMGLSVYDSMTGWGGHATDGTKFIDARSTTTAIAFAFNSPISAFGINIVDWGDWGPGTLTYSDAAGHEWSIAFGNRPDDNLLFAGIISEPNIVFAELLIGQNIDGESWCFDEVYYCPIPEPAGLLVLLGGMGSLTGMFLRRRK